MATCNDWHIEYSKNHKKVISTKLPSAISTYFEQNKLIHNYNTRQKDDFHIHTIQCEKGKRPIKIKGCKLWNNLPAEIKMIQSCSSFKYKFKTITLYSVWIRLSLDIWLHMHFVYVMHVFCLCFFSFLLLIFWVTDVLLLRAASLIGIYCFSGSLPLCYCYCVMLS